MRTRRRFTTEFKEAAVASLATTAVADVARLCDISVSVLHRWRKQLSGHAGKRVADRRRFTAKFKAETIERIDGGASILEIAKALEIRANTLHRWRKEAREFGGDAFSGYGRTRGEAPPPRVVKITLDPDEHSSLRAAFENSPARSFPDFARALLLESASADEIAPEAAMANLELRLAALTAVIARIAQSALVRQRS